MIILLNSRKLINFREQKETMKRSAMKKSVQISNHYTKNVQFKLYQFGYKLSQGQFLQKIFRGLINGINGRIFSGGSCVFIYIDDSRQTRNGLKLREDSC
jgi:hypothetical protein